MNYVRKVMSALGGIFLAALLIAALAPKATHGVAAALVQVVNPTSNPVNVSESPANVFTGSCSSSESAGNLAECNISVPAGKRLVVQTVSIVSATAPGVRVVTGILGGTVNGTSSSRISIGVPFSASAAFQDNSVVTQEVRFYTDGNSGPLGCTVVFTDFSGGRLDCSVEGYLVDAP